MIPVGGGNSIGFYGRQSALPDRPVAEIQRTRRDTSEQDGNQSFAVVNSTNETDNDQLPPTQRVNRGERPDRANFERYAVEDTVNPRERRALEAYFSVESNTVSPPGQGELVGLDVYV